MRCLDCGKEFYCSGYCQLMKDKRTRQSEGTCWCLRCDSWGLADMQRPLNEHEKRCDRSDWLEEWIRKAVESK